ncbi:MAG: divergent PAP2 family protein [Synechococcus sp. SB0668_bin_15]|nr:divergent PAP2 family protein [Synechococcus sp. SB0668_bin_15]MXZ82836.1 divergent PAP2 family protein [Synechococcus sp. SB0666_bin_14]MYA90202.1 divergent PAP2 family protein [Synechococcus sp. SB0663_bin_10]MYC49305.1 divergent PAP2 family protein [Synechococcus sp. SB0662_bin_14]MYG46970.1 divergent PAP2 family protein [Synechococcus sp. SB0675_bin_6]MYJ60445.1 divergent PAP2 family protein [Synechococcus sp. SB0672_bin_6]MYK91761.1 divergent PAP2 family protein [Synechococcus sp. SB0
MDALTALADNAVLAWALLACGAAQCSKLLVVLVTERQWRPSVLLETGGMPSSHATLVSGVAAGVGWQVGFDQPLFALACALALVVMYDASGVRRAAGLQAQRLNALMTTPVDAECCSPLDPLNTNLGHTRRQVFVGAVLGIAVVLLGISQVGGILDALARVANL